MSCISVKVSRKSEGVSFSVGRIGKQMTVKATPQDEGLTVTVRDVTLRLNVDASAIGKRLNVQCHTV